MTVRLELGDCIEVMRKLRRENLLVDAAVTDAPYHLASIVKRLGSPTAAPIQSGATGVYARSSTGFMGQTWDGGDVAFRPETWRGVYDLLKPGAHLIAFGGTRTYHRMVTAIEDAGFEIRDQLAWLYGTGFPKSHDAGDGRGTALKPALEPIVMARKPLAFDSVVENIAANGVGAINIDGCRIHAPDAQGGAYTVKRLAPGAQVNATGAWKQDEIYNGHAKPGRWPANVLHDGSEEVLQAFAEFGERGAIAPVHRRGADNFRGVYGSFKGDIDEEASTFRGDSGTAARFFYSAKASDSGRIFRCRQCGAHQLGKPSCGHKDGRGNPDFETHPTVKPVELMRWLVRLICPPGGLVLDPFAGTGTTGAAAMLEGCNALLIERERSYAADICIRLGLPLEELEAAQVAPLPSKLDDLGPLFGGAAA